MRLVPEIKVECDPGVERLPFTGIEGVRVLSVRG